MDLALSLLAKSGGSHIVETGCAHTRGDWSGAGLSTVVFGKWCKRYGGHLVSVDIDLAHIAAAKAMTRHQSKVINFVQADSVVYLHGRTSPIDLLYLDSLDYPYGAILDAYGGKDDLARAIRAAAEIPESEIVNRFDDVILPSQEHCARELVAALPLLHQRSLVLIDDAGLPGGGKARLAKQILKAGGWSCIMDAYQTLWSQ